MKKGIEPPYKHLTPFKRCVLQNFPFIEADFDALTNYGLLSKVVEYLNKVIEAQNTVQGNVQALNNAFIELKDYVDNYFKNLDVQDEINNKLDEMVESGELADIIDQYFSNPVKYVFPGRWGEQTTSCNANLVIADKKVFLFDTADSQHYSYVKQMLTENDITHLDYVIISHYDNDHCGNFVSLVDDGYIDSETKFYHGMYSSEFYSSPANYNTIEAKCESENITSVCPSDGSTITDGKITLKFGNTNLTYGEAHYSNANEASMVVMFSAPNSTSLFMGDALWRAEQYLYETNFVDREIDLYCIPHHAIEKTTYLNFLKQVSPRIAFAQTQFEDYLKNKISRNKESAILAELGAKLYYSFNHSANPIFIERNGSFYSPNAAVDGTVGAELDTTTTFYVDASTTAYYQNGTSEYPFKDLPQALGRIGSMKNASIVIYLADGEYGVLNTVDMLKNQAGLFNNVKINIIGESKSGTILKQGILAINANVIISNVTIYPNTSSKNGLFSEFSNITLSNVTFDNGDGVTGATGALIQRNSNVIFTNVDFNNLEIGLEQYGSITEFNNISADTVTSLIKLSETASISISDLDTITDVTNLFYNTNGIVKAVPVTQTVTQTKDIMDITLEQDNKLYNTLIITGNIQRNGSNYGTIFATIPYANRSGITIGGMNIHAGDNTPIVYAGSLTASLSGNTFSITRNGGYTSTSEATTFYNGTNASSKEGIKITSIKYVRM